MRKEPFTRDELLARIQVTDADCWEWTGPIDRDGYGRALRNLAHREMVLAFGRDIPTGMQVDHLCRNRRCVNPDHLEVVTPQENSRRSLSPWGINARKTHCKRGHLFDQANTLWTKSGKRSCRACTRERGRAKPKRVFSDEYRAKKAEYDKARNARLKAERTMTLAEDSPPRQH